MNEAEYVKCRLYFLMVAYVTHDDKFGRQKSFMLTQLKLFKTMFFFLCFQLLYLMSSIHNRFSLFDFKISVFFVEGFCCC